MPQYAPDILIVQHVWQYWSLWSYSVSSLFQWPPECHVEMRICCTEADDRAKLWFDYYASLAKRPKTVTMSAHWMERDYLLRRGIGRNEVCRANDARKLVILADCDYLYGKGCLDGILAAFPEGGVLAYARRIQKCQHAVGDQLISEAQEPGVRRIDRSLFNQVARMGRAVGGCQVVAAEVAREKGYLPDGHRFLQPAGRWMKTNEDVCARRWMAGNRGTPLDVPNAFRIRHTQYGREHVGIEN